MGSRQTTAKLKRGDGELVVQDSHSDAPLIPVPHLEKLHGFRPDLVDWVVAQTEREADTRRLEDKRINTFIFVERILGQIFALTIGVSAIVGGVYAAVSGAETAGGIIASVGVGGLAAVFITGKGKSQ